VIADQSVNHVERYVIDEGHIAHRIATDAHTKVYKHAGTGALLVLPTPSEKRLIPHHLVATRMALDAFGLAPPSDFAAQL